VSESTISGSLQVTALSSLATLSGAPAATDLVFGVFNGEGQFVEQSQIWSGAVPTVGGAVSGPISWSGTPSSADHLTPKSYVDAQVATVTGAVGSSAAQAVAAATDAQNAALGAANSATTAINAQKGSAGGVVPLSSSGAMMLGGVEFMGVSSGIPILVIDLPTTDPSVSGAMFNNGGYVMVSAG